MKTKFFVAISTVILVSAFYFSTTTLADEPDNIEQLYNNANDLYNQANYVGAIALYTQALEESKIPGVRTEMIDKDINTFLNYRIAVTYSRLAEQTDNANHYINAIQHIEKVAPTATTPKHKEGLIYLWGHILYRTQQYELAEEKFRQLIVNYPVSLQVENALYAIGQLNYKMQNYEKSRSVFRDILAKFPTSEFKDDAQLLIGQSFLNEQNFEIAYKEFNKLTSTAFEQYPELQAEASYKAAYCLYQLDKNEDAIRRYSDFIKMLPDNKFVTAAYFDLATIYLRQIDYDRARLNYKMALQSTDNQELKSEIQAKIGESYFKQADYVNAIGNYEVLIDLYPESLYVADAKLGIADGYFRLERWNQAITAYREVIEYQTDEKQRFAGMGQDYIPYSSYQIAEAYFKLGTSQKEIGQLKLATSSFKQALISYQNTIDDFPDNKIVPHAAYGIFWTLNELERYNDLENSAKEYIQRYRNDIEFDIYAAEVHLRLADIKREEYKQYVDAAREYANISDYPKLPEFDYIKIMAKFFEGQCYFEAAKPTGYKEGDPLTKLNTDLLKKSVAAFQEVSKRYSDETFLQSVKEGLYLDFPERIPRVEAALMNEAKSQKMLGNLDAARNCYKRIPASSDFYEQAQLELKKLTARN